LPISGAIIESPPWRRDFKRRPASPSAIAKRWQDRIQIARRRPAKHLASLRIIADVVRVEARGRYFNTVDPVNRLEDEARRSKAGVLATQLSSRDVVVLDELS
jgi:dihydropteroate synthase